MPFAVMQRKFGLVSPKGLYRVEELLAKVEQSQEVPELAREMFKVLAGQFRHAEAQICEIEATLMALHRDNEVSQRLAAIPSVGPIGAMAMAARSAMPTASVRDAILQLSSASTPKQSHHRRQKVSWGITRAGDEKGSHLVCGATAVIHQLKTGRGHNSLWLKGIPRGAQARKSLLRLHSPTRPHGSPGS